MEQNVQERIKKEEIPHLHCNCNEVLNKQEEIKKRIAELKKAANKGQSFYSKTRIVFLTEEGLKEVTTTVFAVTDQNVVLKGGINIPVCCIKQVKEV